MMRNAHIRLAFAALAALIAAACASGADDRVPEMPPFKDADGFLRMQQKAERFRDSSRNRPSSRHPFTERNERIFREVERLRRNALREQRHEEAIREKNRRRAQTRAQRDFEAYRERLVQDELAAAERAMAAGGRSRNRFRRRFDNYQDRLERLVRQREMEARAFDEERARVQNERMRSFQSRVERLAAEQEANEALREQNARERRDEIGRRVLQSAPAEEESQ